MLFRTLSGIGGFTAAALALAGCSATTTSDSEDSGLVSVVASTNVYGNIAAQVGGEFADVVSIIDSPNQDPHSYEASVRQQLALSNADVVVKNGGGYDPFIDTLLDAAGNDDVALLDAVEISGYDTSQPEFNEHVWYDFPSMIQLTDELVSAMSTLDRTNADAFRANGDRFIASLEGLRETEAELAARVGGTGVAITEAVPLYLLDASGLINRTPSAFSESIEEGTDVPPLVLQQTLDLFDDGAVRLLAYNEQTAGPETERLRAAAEDAGVPIVSVTETMPTDEDYLGWMSANLEAISEALS